MTDTMAQSAPRSDGRLAHGVALVFLIGLALCFAALRRWPWVWLVPLGAYLSLVACVPRFRREFAWLRFGRLSAGSVSLTVGIMVLTSSTLLLFHVTAQPDVSGYRSFLPQHLLASAVLGGSLFATLNSVLEEFIF